MAFDEREYLLKKFGWNPRKLSGFRRSVRQEIEETNQFDVKSHLAEKRRQRKIKRTIFALWIALIAFTAWTIWHS
ncbi:hypothetical protein GALL_71030 [mine drainage metagenome]|uniref:Uncharacterized protein n=1 Tax=mine drainage metagenome TaxID=410659 RepID=A0A1J5SR63_9ZZZZ